LSQIEFLEAGAGVEGEGKDRVGNVSGLKFPAKVKLRPNPKAW